jgi:predicted site-specific integrase-resolvase
MNNRTRPGAQDPERPRRLPDTRARQHDRAAPAPGGHPSWGARLRTQEGGRGVSPTKPRRAAIYARVSTTDQTAENQLLALRDFAMSRGWAVTVFVDSGVSGAKEKRPALDAMLAAVRARKVDSVSCVKLDRLARSVHHLVGISPSL